MADGIVSPDNEAQLLADLRSWRHYALGPVGKPASNGTVANNPARLNVGLSPPIGLGFQHWIHGLEKR